MSWIPTKKEFLRDTAITGFLGAQAWMIRARWAMHASSLGFAGYSLGAATSAVAMSVGLPILAGYGMSYAIAGDQGIDDFEYFMTNPSQWPLLVVQSLVAVTSELEYEEYDASEEYDPFAGTKHRQEQALAFPFMA